MTISSNDFIAQSVAALQEAERLRTRKALGKHMPALRTRAVEEFGDFEGLREHVANVRQHAFKLVYNAIPTLRESDLL